MSDRERSEKRRSHKGYGPNYPVFSDSYEADEISLPDFREICDLCMKPRKPGKRKLYGRAVTYVNADKLVHWRDLAELALKLYNDNKVCKINRLRPGYCGLTFRAQEDGSEECPVFRGVAHALRGKKEALFCEIKDDDEITLLPCDDDYVSSGRASESED